jgi:hypothetical protein
MILTGENQSSWKETCFSPFLSTTDPTGTGLLLNVDHQGDMPMANHLSHGTDGTHWADVC